MLRKTQLDYLVRESFSGFHRRKLTTGVTILIMGAALLVLALLTVVTLNMGNFLSGARESIDVRVFVQDGLSNDTLSGLQPRLLALPGVGGVTFISQEAALAEFRQQLGADADVVDLLDTNPLPASYVLTMTAAARNSQSVQNLITELSVFPEVAESVYNQKWIDSLERWTYRFQIASLVVGLIVFFSAVFVISNTVRLTIASSARVIEIQKLVGATNNFIRTPFLCEGMIQGLLAGVLAMTVLGLAGYFLQDYLDGLIFFSPLQMVGFVAFCVVLGLAGSYSAMRKYLTIEGAL